jgi:hypothetical protein
MPLRQASPRAAGVGVLLPLVAALVAYFFWNTPFVYPLKIFVVFLHELSHGLAALVTGGSIERIELSTAEGGLCITRGGNELLILNAGYLGSLLFGAFFLVVGARLKHDREVLAIVGAVVLLVTLLYVRTAFGFAYGLAAGIVLLLVALRLPAAVADLVLAIIGAVSCLYAVWDIASDVLLRDPRGSDAGALARLTGIPAAVWGVAWCLVSLAVVGLALRLAARKS